LPIVWRYVVFLCILERNFKKKTLFCWEVGTHTRGHTK